MDGTAITIIVFISIAIILIAFVTLFNKGCCEGDDEGHPNKIQKRSTTAGHMHLGNGVSAANNGMDAGTAVAVFIVMNSDGGGCVGGGGGGFGGGF